MPDNEHDSIADTATFRAFFDEGNGERTGRTLSTQTLAWVLAAVVATVALVALLLL